MKVWRITWLGGLLNELMNELMSDKGDCRTAPATPGLLHTNQVDCLFVQKYKKTIVQMTAYVMLISTSIQCTACFRLLSMIRFQRRILKIFFFKDNFVVLFFKLTLLQPTTYNMVILNVQITSLG